MNEIIKSVFAECARAIDAGELISNVSATDKEFAFQNWFRARLKALNVNHDDPSRNAYPDFTLVDYPLGFEIKGLGFPGRDANYDCNSQVPSGMHNRRTIYYVFGRYPSAQTGANLPVYDLVFCHGDFLNADHEYVHVNKNLKGFGSYGDLMIRDRKMYVAPTPYALAEGTERQVTLIAPADAVMNDDLRVVGFFDRVESTQLVRGYSFDLVSHDLTPTYTPNPNAGLIHSFKAYRLASSAGPAVALK
jgi:hypothetical protein